MLSIQSIYLAFFGRPADPLGLAYWETQTKGGSDLSLMLDALSGTEEYQSRFDGMNDAEVIESIYQALFGRDADAEGLAFFVDALANGTQTLSSIAVNILDGARGSDLKIIENKVAAAEIFTAALDTVEEIIAYSGNAAADFGRQFISHVTDDTTSIPDKEAVQELIDSDLPDYTAPEVEVPPLDEDEDKDVTDSAVKTGRDIVSDEALDEGDVLYVGGGNSSGNFQITTTTVSEIELALKGYHRGIGDVPQSEGIYHFTPTDKAGFAFSVASLGGKTLKELMAEGYTFHLKIDNDPGKDFGPDAVDLQMVHDEHTVSNAQDSGYDWVGHGHLVSDDEGSGGFVTQNIQSPVWYGAPGATTSVLAPGDYSISMEVRKNGEAIATETIVLDVSEPAVTVGSLLPVATNGGTVMINGSGNTADGFSIIEVDVDKDSVADVEIALGAQERKGLAIHVDNDGIVHFSSGSGDGSGNGVPMFKYSIASMNDNQLVDLLETHDFKLFIDTDPGAGTSFIELDAVASDGGSTGAFDWMFKGDWTDGSGAPKLTDDAGNEFVSQNIQSLGWYQPDGDRLFDDPASHPGEYAVSLAVFDKGTTELVGLNTIVFEVLEAA